MDMDLQFFIDAALAGDFNLLNTYEPKHPSVIMDLFTNGLMKQVLLGGHVSVCEWYQTQYGPYPFDCDLWTIPAQNGDLKMCKWLLANTTYTERAIRCMFFAASTNGQIGVVKWLVALIPTMGAVTKDDWTFGLSRVAQRGNVDMIQILGKHFGNGKLKFNHSVVLKYICLAPLSSSASFEIWSRDFAFNNKIDMKKKDIDDCFLLATQKDNKKCFEWLCTLFDGCSVDVSRLFLHVKEFGPGVGNFLVSFIMETKQSISLPPIEEFKSSLDCKSGVANPTLITHVIVENKGAYFRCLKQELLVTKKDCLPAFRYIVKHDLVDSLKMLFSESLDFSLFDIVLEKYGKSPKIETFMFESLLKPGALLFLMILLLEDNSSKPLEFFLHRMSHMQGKTPTLVKGILDNIDVEQITTMLRRYKMVVELRLWQDINRTNAQTGWDVVICAIQKGEEVHIPKHLLVDTKEARQALRAAIEYGRVDVLKLFHEKKMKLDDDDDDDDVRLAVQTGHATVIQYLVSHFGVTKHDIHKVFAPTGYKYPSMAYRNIHPNAAKFLDGFLGTPK